MRKNKGERRKLKKLLALIIVGAFILALLPSISLSVTPHPEFAIKINGEFTSDPPDHTGPVVFKGLQECTTFEVEIIAWQVVDLYAYEFQVEWSTPGGAGFKPVITLTDHEVKHIHDPDFVIVETAYNDAYPYPAGYGFYHQAVTAIEPAVGATGTFTVANLYFHIDVNPQWPTDIFVDFTYSEAKMANSCDEDLTPSDQGGCIKLQPIPPILKMLPPITISSVIGETFEVQIEIQNVVKMKSFHFRIEWDDHQMTTDAQNVWIKDFLPPPYESAYIYVGDSDANYVNDYMLIDVVSPCEKPSIDGTGELMGIRFTTLSPWGTVWTQDNVVPGNWPDPYALERNAIPPYAVLPAWAKPYESPHDIWYPDKCFNEITIEGYIDKDLCGQVTQTLYDVDGVWVKPWYADWYDKLSLDWDYQYGANTDAPGFYEFRAIPGDLNLDGHVDIEDLSAMAKVYGKDHSDTVRNGWPFYCDYPPTFDANEWYFSYGDDLYHYFADFDLNLDFVVDIFDVVIVAKNFCRTEPDPLLPQPLPDP